MDWALRIFAGIWQGTKAQKFQSVADILGMIAPVLKNQDNDKTGIDDDLARFAVAAAKIFGNLAKGPAGGSNMIKAIDGALEVLTALREKFVAESTPVDNGA